MSGKQFNEISDNPCRSASQLEKIIVVLFFVGLYTYIPFGMGGVKFPPMLPGLFSVMLFFVSLKGKIEKKLLRNLIVIIFISMLSVIFAPHFSEYVMERTKGLIYLSYSIFTALIITVSLKKWPRKDLAILFMGFSLVIIIGSFLENYTDLKKISDSFREHVIIENLYDADDRDISKMGGVRPKFFTAEPSFVATFLMFSIISWYLYSDNKYKHVVYIVLFIIGMASIRSPVLILMALFYVLHFLISLNLASNKITKKIAVNSVIIVVLAASGSYLAKDLISERIGNIIAFEDLSFLSRNILPIFVAVETVKISPIFGAGISGYEYVESITEDTFADLGIPIYFDQSELAGKIVNIFWGCWINLGVVGGAIFIYAFHKQIKAFGLFNTKDMLFFYATILMFTQIMGGINGVKFWSMAFILSIAFIKTGETKNNKNASSVSS